MAYSDLKAHIRDVTHRSDLTDARMDTWSQAVTARVNDELETATMYSDIEQTVSRNGFNVAEFLSSGRLMVGYRIIEVAYQGDNGWYSLQGTDWKTVRNWSREDGDPKFYTQLGSLVWLAPYKAGDYKFKCRIDVKGLINNSDSNVVLSAHPNIYYYGMLQQVYEYMQDYASADRYKVLYDQEFDRANAVNARRVTPQSPQMSGAWAWV